MDTSVWGFRVMTRSLVNLQEHLERGSRNIFRLCPPIYDQHNLTGHPTTIDNFSIVGEGGPELH